MNKLIVQIVLFLVLISFAIATLFLDEQNEFTIGLSEENLTFGTLGDSIGRYLSIPLYAFITNYSITLNGFSTEIDYDDFSTYPLDVDKWNESVFSDPFGGGSTTAQYNCTVINNKYNCDLYASLGESANVITIMKDTPSDERIYFTYDLFIDTDASAQPSSVSYFFQLRNYSYCDIVGGECNNNVGSHLWYEQFVGVDGLIHSRNLSIYINTTDNNATIRNESNGVIMGSINVAGRAGNYFTIKMKAVGQPGGEDAYLKFNLSNLDFNSSITNVTIITGGSYDILSSPGRTIKKPTNYTLNTSAIQSVINNGCTCTNCSISSTDCLIPVIFKSDTEGILEYSNLNASYQFGVDDCSTFLYPIINFTYRDQLDNALISLKNDYDIELIYPFSQSLSGNLTNIQAYGFCSSVNYTDVNYSFTGEFTLSKDEYGTQIYEYSVASPLIGRIPSVSYTQYLSRLNETSTIVFTWRTNTFENVDGSMEIYTCSGDGTRTLVGTSAIINGEAYANLELINTPYSYEVIYNGVRYTNDDSYTKCHIETQTTRLYIIDVGTPTAPVTGLYSIPCNVTRTGNFTFTMEWGENPESDSTITGCYEAIRQTVRGSSIVAEVCETTSGISGVLTDSGFTYLVKGRLYQNGYSIECQDWLVFETAADQNDTFGITGILAIFFLVCGTILLFINEKAKWFPIMGVVGILLAWGLGILAFGWPGIASLVAFVIVIIVVGRYSKKQ